MTEHDGRPRHAAHGGASGNAAPARTTSTVRLVPPISGEQILALQAGDVVSISGVILTARDAAHKFMVEHLIDRPPAPEDRPLYDELRRVLAGGVIFHCGPIVRRVGERWEFVSGGPTTSIRAEIYEPEVIGHFGVRVVIGKGGMGDGTLAALRQFKAVYVHGIGGAGALTARAVKEVLAVYKEAEFGLPEAFWKIRVEDLTGIVTMDAHGQSLHRQIEDESAQVLAHGHE
ncbi:MAG: FumA C-terminus/TtdB family hydratase beta subunit [Bacillota bacterium]